MSRMKAVANTFDTPVPMTIRQVGRTDWSEDAQIARFTGPPWGPPGVLLAWDGHHVGPINLAIRMVSGYMPRDIFLIQLLEVLSFQNSVSDNWTVTHVFQWIWLLSGTCIGRRKWIEFLGGLKKMVFFHSPTSASYSDDILCVDISMSGLHVTPRGVMNHMTSLTAMFYFIDLLSYRINNYPYGSRFVIIVT